MARAVARAVTGQRHLVVQAGTGTGKSLGYLLPCILTGQRTVIATATKALQDQLAGKDLPFLARNLDHPFETAVLKGRSNYLCLQRLAEVFPGGSEGRQPSLDLDAGVISGLGQELHLLAAWAATTPTGDRAELDFEPRARAWSQLSVTAVECPGASKCPKGGDCFAEAARRRAEEADVIVVNTALYGMHLASGGRLLPEHDVVVFDEAHELEDVAATALGLELSAGRFDALARVAAGVVTTADVEATRAVAEAGETLASLLERMEGDSVVSGPGGLADKSLAAALALADSRVRVVQQALRRADAGDGSETAARKARAQQAAGHLVGDLAMVAALPESHVAWVERGGAQRQPVLRVAAVDVGAILAGRLWGEVSAVLTSATIPPGIVTRLGLPPETTDVIDVGSPFEHRAQGLLYVPKHLPDPRRPGADEAMAEELGWLIRAAGGRTLALFTSFRRMEMAAAALEGSLPGPLLRQGDLPKPALVAAFAADESASLFATMGFWQGIDVPGRTLSVVAIDRLPFPRPDEPLWKARRDRAGARAFALVDLPRAATLLAQGAGRLLRTAKDRGVVAVLDPRLATAGYRREVLASMPPLKRSVSRHEVAAFLCQLPGADTE